MKTLKEIVDSKYVSHISIIHTIIKDGILYSRTYRTASYRKYYKGVLVFITRGYLSKRMVTYLGEVYINSPIGSKHYE